MITTSAALSRSVTASGSPSRRSWRVPLRLASREVRRRPWRTLLVVILVIIPVAAMTIGDILVRTLRDTPGQQYRRVSGNSDLTVYGWQRPIQADRAIHDEPADPPMMTLAELSSRLPAGSRITEVRQIGLAPIRAEGVTYGIRAIITDVPYTPVTAPITVIRSGRFPSTVGEAMVSTSLAKQLNAQLGSQVTFTRPRLTVTVVGIGDPAAQLTSDQLIITPSELSALNAVSIDYFRLVELPTGTQESQIDHLGVSMTSAGGNDAAAMAGVLAWGWVAGAIALAVMGIIICAAFATSARRLVTLGQLSANGADQSTLRRSLVAQGVLSGLIGGLVGVAAGIVAVVSSLSFIERRIAKHTIGSTVIAVPEMLIIVLTAMVIAGAAAFVPARAVARVPVLNALAGRRPAGATPTKLIPIGLALVGAGLLLLFVGASTGADSDSKNVVAGVAVVGGLALLAGMCALTPVIIGVLGPVGEAIGGSGRLAARSLARARPRSAAIVSAIAAAAAVVVVVATMVTTFLRPSDAVPYVPADTVYVEGWRFGGDVAEPAAVDPQVLADVGAILPQASMSEVRRVTASWTDRPTAVTVADPGVLEALQLDAADRQALQRGEVLALWEYSAQSDGDTVRIGASELPVRRATTALRSQLLIGFPLVAPTAVNSADIAVSGALFHLPAATTAEQRAALGDMLSVLGGPGYDPFSDAVRSTEFQLSYWSPGQWRPSAGLVELALVAALVAFVTGVVAVGLMLAAAETADELQTMNAVGARPRSLAAVAGIKATLLAGLGGALAIPVALGAIAVVVSAAKQRTIVVPWMTIASLLFIVPTISGLGAFAASRLGQRFRPTRITATD